MRRLHILLPLCWLAACQEPQNSVEEVLAENKSADRIACAVDGASDFEEVCAIERLSSDEGTILTLRAPSGSFRRLRIADDGRGVVAADGAAPAQVTVLADDRIEVMLDGDRYRLPATVKK